MPVISRTRTLVGWCDVFFAYSTPMAGFQQQNKAKVFRQTLPSWLVWVQTMSTTWLLLVVTNLKAS